MMGFTLMENFNTPYFALSITDFWRRWHMSLSTWLRQYLYIPLGGSRGTTFRTYRNLMITMILGGLWHGAAANYLVWGAYQGLLLALERGFRTLRGQGAITNRFAPSIRAIQLLVTFHLVCLGWIFFRATPGSPLALMARRFINPVGWLSMPWSHLGPALLAITPLLALDLARRWSGRDLVLLSLPWPARGLLYTALAYVFILFGRFDSHAFIYFQF